MGPRSEDRGNIIGDLQKLLMEQLQWGRDQIDRGDAASVPIPEIAYGRSEELGRNATLRPDRIERGGGPVFFLRRPTGICSEAKSPSEWMATSVVFSVIFCLI